MKRSVTVNEIQYESSNKSTSSIANASALVSNQRKSRIQNSTHQNHFQNHKSFLQGLFRSNKAIDSTSSSHLIIHDSCRLLNAYSLSMNHFNDTKYTHFFENRKTNKQGNMVVSSCWIQMFLFNPNFILTFELEILIKAGSNLQSIFIVYGINFFFFLIKDSEKILFYNFYMFQRPSKQNSVQNKCTQFLQK